MGRKKKEELINTVKLDRYQFIESLEGIYRLNGTSSLILIDGLRKNKNQIREQIISILFGIINPIECSKFVAHDDNIFLSIKNNSTKFYVFDADAGNMRGLYVNAIYCNGIDEKDKPIFNEMLINYENDDSSLNFKAFINDFTLEYKGESENG